MTGKDTFLLVTFVHAVTLTLCSWTPVFWPGTREHIQGDDVIVNITSGLLRGKRRPGDSRAGGYIQQVDYFLGIPYAAPPVGDLRFMPTEPVQPWSGIRNATRYGYMCPQRDGYTQIAYNEDCLTLNVYAPYEPDANARYPVMVYVHGGSYRVGTGATYPGQLLAQRGVVVVTINYRLCILGFLSSRDGVFPGNNGLLDQIEALRWVKDNIAVFRGDPDKVTLFGNSAGGASVGILAVSPLARGLFSQIIAQSGSPMSFWAIHNDSVDLAQYVKDVAQVYQCEESTLEELMVCLRKVDPLFLGHCTGEHIPSISASNTNFRPHVDDLVLPDDIRELYRTGDINAKAIMAGVVDREWSQHIGLMIPELMRDGDNFDNHMEDGMERESFLKAMHHVFCKKFGWGEHIAKTVIHEYTNWHNIDDAVENREQYIKFMTELGMVAPTAELANIVHCRDIPVYLYQFNHKSSEDVKQWKSNAHSVELHYTFGAPFLGYDVVYGVKKNFSDADRDISSYMMNLWTDFAKHGNPSYSTSDQAVWERFTSETTDYLAISDQEIAMHKHLKPDGVSFWNEVVPGLLNQTHGNTDQSCNSLEDTQKTLWGLLALCIIMGLIILGLALLLHKSKGTDASTNKAVHV